MTLIQGRWTDAVHQGLQNMLTHYSRPLPKRPLAVFDWDNTCITGDIGEAVLRHLDTGHHPGCVAKYLELCETYDKSVGYQFCAETMGGLTESQAETLVNEVIDRQIAAGSIQPRPEIEALMHAMTDSGWDVWVVTASAEPIVRAFAPRYKQPADRVIGVDLAVKNGIIQSVLAGPLTYRQGKVDAIDQRIGRRPTFAAGDALTDYEMLHAAPHALLFDHNEPELLAAAQSRGWWVQPPF